MNRSAFWRRSRRPTRIQFSGLIESMSRGAGAVCSGALRSSCVVPGKRREGYCRLNVTVSTRWCFPSSCASVALKCAMPPRSGYAGPTMTMCIVSSPCQIRGDRRARIAAASLLFGASVSAVRTDAMAPTVSPTAACCSPSSVQGVEYSGLNRVASRKC